MHTFINPQLTSGKTPYGHPVRSSAPFRTPPTYVSSRSTRTHTRAHGLVSSNMCVHFIPQWLITSKMCVRYPTLMDRRRRSPPGPPAIAMWPQLRYVAP